MVETSRQAWLSEYDGGDVKVDMQQFVSENKSEDLKAKDFVGKNLKVTIERVEEVVYPANDRQQEQKKAVLYFEGKEKRLVLNATNTETLCNAFTAASAEWLGKEISLTTKDYSAEGFGVGWIVAALNPDFDDSIPF